MKTSWNPEFLKYYASLIPSLENKRLMGKDVLSMLNEVSLENCG